MILEFTRTGGIGGTKLGCTVDTEQLASDKAQAIHALVSRVRPERLRAGVDRFSYSLKITQKTEEGDRSNTFRFGEGSHPELVGYLTTMAKQPVG